MGFSNYPPASHPVRSRFQRDQSFGWVPPAASGSNPGGAGWVKIGDKSANPIFGNFEFHHRRSRPQARRRGGQTMDDRNSGIKAHHSER